ncbi:MAG: HEAT repeat domain-containing protein [Candidatus Riflebacteria bacterium]|nr:HEAT repeat domain-containing protein [Candidatus Riflebacteria bacterium]
MRRTSLVCFLTLLGGAMIAVTPDVMASKTVRKQKPKSAIPAHSKPLPDDSVSTQSNNTTNEKKKNATHDSPTEEIQEIREANRLADNGDFDGAIALLEKTIADGKSVNECRAMLFKVLEARIPVLTQGKPAAALSEKTAQDVVGVFKRSCELKPTDQPFFRRYLEFLAARPDLERTFILEGMSFLRRDENIPAGSWAGLLKKLDAAFQKNNKPIFRARTLEIITRISGSGAKTAKTTLDEVRKALSDDLENILKKTHELAVSGEFDEAVWTLGVLDRAAPGSPLVRDERAAIERERQLKPLIDKATQAVQKEDLEQAEKIMREITSMGISHPALPELRQGIERLKKRSEVTRQGSPSAKAVAALVDAEKDEDLARVRELLIQLKELGTANSDQLLRLAALERELADSRTKLPERLKEAESLSTKGDWESLHRLFNRNPDLKSYSVDASELHLAGDFELGKLAGAELEEAMNQILRDKPKSFWISLIHCKIALNAHQESDAQRFLAAAAAIDPSHPALNGPRSQLNKTTNRRAIYAGLMVIILVLLGWLIPRLFGLFEAVEWIFMERMIRQFPKRALSRLEKHIGVFEDKEKRIHLYEMLTEAAAASGNTLKIERYGEELYDLMPRNRIALEHLGKFYMTLPVLHPKQAEITSVWATMHPNNRDALKEIAGYVRETADLRPIFAPHLLRQLELSGDAELTAFLREAYLKCPSVSLGREGLRVLDCLWKITHDERILSKLWQGFVASGLFEQAKKLPGDAREDGKTISPASMLDELELELAGEEKTIIEQIRSTHGDIRVGHIQEILVRGYFSSEQGRELLALTGDLIEDDDPASRYASQKARNHLRETTLKIEVFRKSLGIASVPHAAQIAATTEAGPASGQMAPVPVSGEAGPASAAPAADISQEIPVAITLISLSESASGKEIFELAGRSNETDIPAWEAYLTRNLPISTLSIVMKSLGAIHSKLLTPTLLKYLKHSNPRVRANVIESLEENGDSTVTPYLLPLMRDPDNRIRANAIKALHYYKVAQADAELRIMAGESHVRMRDSAIFVLKSIKLPWTALVLKGLLNDPEQVIRIRAIQALAEQNLPGNLDILKQHAEKPINMEEREAIELAFRQIDQAKPEPFNNFADIAPIPPAGPAAHS